MDAIAVISSCFPKKTTASTKGQKITKFSTALLWARLAREAHAALARYSGSGVFSVFHNPVSSILYTTYGTKKWLSLQRSVSSSTTLLVDSYS